MFREIVIWKRARLAARSAKFYIPLKMQNTACAKAVPSRRPLSRNHEIKVASENKMPSSLFSTSPTTSFSVSLCCGEYFMETLAAVPYA